MLTLVPVELALGVGANCALCFLSQQSVALSKSRGNTIEL